MGLRGAAGTFDSLQVTNVGLMTGVSDIPDWCAVEGGVPASWPAPPSALEALWAKSPVSAGPRRESTPEFSRPKSGPTRITPEVRQPRPLHAVLLRAPASRSSAAVDLRPFGRAPRNHPRLAPPRHRRDHPPRDDRGATPHPLDRRSSSARVRSPSAPSTSRAPAAIRPRALHLLTAPAPFYSQVAHRRHFRARPLGHRPEGPSRAAVAGHRLLPRAQGAGQAVPHAHVPARASKSLSSKRSLPRLILARAPSSGNGHRNANERLRVAGTEAASKSPSRQDEARLG